MDNTPTSSTSYHFHQKKEQMWVSAICLHPSSLPTPASAQALMQTRAPYSPAFGRMGDNMVRCLRRHHQGFTPGSNLTWSKLDRRLFYRIRSQTRNRHDRNLSHCPPTTLRHLQLHKHQRFIGKCRILKLLTTE